jgi:hypothetical protein
MAAHTIRLLPDLAPTQFIGAEVNGNSLYTGNTSNSPISVPLVTPGPPEYPYMVQLGSLQSGAFRSIKAIPVIIDRGEDCFTATWRDIDEFGYGDNSAAALHDLCRSVTALYRSLEHDRACLGEDLKHVLATMQEHFVPTR